MLLSIGTDAYLLFGVFIWCFNNNVYLATGYHLAVTWQHARCNKATREGYQYAGPGKRDCYT